ncbi:sensor histidine kinase [Pedobacter nototheniae]|uniref:sensor histidine kinase n=1 Tax=Pedobacter nototheniae TaxID=2488994 RepID=UPI00292DC7AA|nr:sensor histidine kinase [Pedobacter nototheniae]
MYLAINKYYDFSAVIKKEHITFPVVFEILIWLFYVAMYKYSYYLDQDNLPKNLNSSFPYLEICLYSICSTLFIIPYYRWLIPFFLQRKKYLLLVIGTIVYFFLIAPFNNYFFSWIFARFTEGLVVHSFLRVAYNYWGFNLLLTDFIAFFCIGMARFSYQNEIQRHKTETDNLNLQLNMLKTQLQPHFLFNTLNSLYGLSLVGSKDTPRFILLLSQMMQYILYDCDQEEVGLQGEIDFLNGYFELEQKKFPKARITFQAPDVSPSIKIPPLLFLPLVENCFKHGKHKLEDDAVVEAALMVNEKQIIFTFKNDLLKPTHNLLVKKPGGIGLSNLKKRMELYYAGSFQLRLNESNNEYIAELIIGFK